MVDEQLENIVVLTMLGVGQKVNVEVQISTTS